MGWNGRVLWRRWLEQSLEAVERWLGVAVVLLASVGPVVAQSTSSAGLQPAILSFNAWTAQMRATLSGNRDLDLARLNQAKTDAVSAPFLTMYPQAQGPLLGNLDRIISQVGQTQPGQPYPRAVNESAGQIAKICQWVRQQLTAANGGQDVYAPAGTTQPVANPPATPAALTNPPQSQPPGPAAPGDSPITLGGVSLETPGGVSPNPNPNGPPANPPAGAPGAPPPPGAPGAANTGTAGVPWQPGPVPQQPGPSGGVPQMPAGPWTGPGSFMPAGYPQSMPPQMAQLMQVLQQLLAGSGGSLEVVSAGVSPNNPNMASVTIRIRPPGLQGRPVPTWPGYPPNGGVQPPMYGPYAPQVPNPQPPAGPQQPDPQSQAALERSRFMQAFAPLEEVLALARDDQFRGWNQFLQQDSRMTPGPNGTQVAVYSVRTQKDRAQRLKQLATQFAAGPVASRYPNEVAAIVQVINGMADTTWREYSSGQSADAMFSQASEMARERRQVLTAAMRDLYDKMQSAR
jgi:hypothetical protein